MNELKELALKAYKQEQQAYQAHLLAKAEEEKKRRETLKSRALSVFTRGLEEVFGKGLEWVVAEVDETSEVPRWARMKNGDILITIKDGDAWYNGKIVKSLADLGRLIKQEQDARDNYSRYDYPA